MPRSALSDVIIYDLLEAESMSEIHCAKHFTLILIDFDKVWSRRLQLLLFLCLLFITVVVAATVRPQERKIFLFRWLISTNRSGALVSSNSGVETSEQNVSSRMALWQRWRRNRRRDERKKYLVPTQYNLWECTRLNGADWIISTFFFSSSILSVTISFGISSSPLYFWLRRRKATLYVRDISTNPFKITTTGQRRANRWSNHFVFIGHMVPKEYSEINHFEFSREKYFSKHSHTTRAAENNLKLTAIQWKITLTHRYLSPKCLSTEKTGNRKLFATNWSKSKTSGQYTTIVFHPSPLSLFLLLLRWFARYFLHQVMKHDETTSSSIV